MSTTQAERVNIPQYPTEILTGKVIAEVAETFAGEQVAVIDLDGTVADSMSPFCMALNTHFQDIAGVNLDYHPTDNVSFNILETLTRRYPEQSHLFTPETVYGVFDNSQIFADAKPIYATMVLVKTLEDLRYKIIYATSRPVHTIKATQEWLTKHRMPVDFLLFEGRNTVEGGVAIQKKELIAALAPSVVPRSVFYDDKAQTLAETARVLLGMSQQGYTINISLFGPPQPWNTGEQCMDPYYASVQHLLATPTQIMERLEIFDT